MMDRVLTGSLLLLLAATVFGQAADAPKLDEKQLVKLLEPYYQEQAAKYEFFLDEAMTQKAEHLAKPVMRWTAEGNSATVWVWTHQGRAEVVGCLGAYVDQDGKLIGFHEFHSLTLQPLQKVEIGAVRTWESRKPGVEPKLLTKAAAPAATDKLRLIQMRSLAREYTVLMRSGEQTHTLRLAPTPLFRFQSTNPEVLDGALFSFLWDNGTDPEFLLLLEARQTAEGQRWHYAPVRFTNREIWLTHDNNELWRGPAHNEFWTRQILRDNYASCAMGVLDLDAIKSKRETKTE